MRIIIREIRGRTFSYDKISLAPPRVRDIYGYIVLRGEIYLHIDNFIAINFDIYSDWLTKCTPWHLIKYNRSACAIWQTRKLSKKGTYTAQ